MAMIGVLLRYADRLLFVAYGSNFLFEGFRDFMPEEFYYGLTELRTVLNALLLDFYG